MVEMNEVANILRNATTRSLLILDEIGRGTSTFDGLSIAWAVVEYIAKVVKAKTLFATHYHELTELEGKLEGVNNYCIAVTNHDQDIVFLRKIIPGGADRSYGIDVASLAGVPKPVIDRAKVIAAELSDADITAKAKNIETSESFTQEAFDEEGFLADRNEEKAAKDIENEAGYGADIREALEYLKALDVNHMTPLDAMNTLYELKSKFGV
jgi:DNA mismatch repair protein MutS